jgi:hypothetical protein
MAAPSFQSVLGKIEARTYTTEELATVLGTATTGLGPALLALFVPFETVARTGVASSYDDRGVCLLGGHGRRQGQWVRTWRSAVLPTVGCFDDAHTCVGAGVLGSVCDGGWNGGGEG